MIIYHGSEEVISTPEYGKGAKANDYGRGFYCTESVELAKEWACGRGEAGFACKYELDISGLKILRLNKEPYNILNWLAILAHNRTYWQRSSISEEAKKYLSDNFLIDYEDYDIIIGYRADDSYFSFAQDFVAGIISLDDLSEAMRLGSLGEQIVLKSSKAFFRLSFLGYEEADNSIYEPKKKERDSKARKKYREIKRNSKASEGLYMLDIIREGIKNGDTRLR